MVSQNLTTPLNLSRFTLDLIEKAVQEKKYNKLDAHIKIMREVTSECIRIIDKFLQEEHLESPNVKAKVNRFDAIAKIRIVSEKLKEANPDKHFRITAESKHVFINADATKFFSDHSQHSLQLGKVHKTGRADRSDCSRGEIKSAGYCRG